jgi:beta-glucosidase-like glycosyl hydrolase
MQPARAMFPALRWDPATGFGHAEPAIASALARGVGGFILFGGDAASVKELTDSLRSRSAAPLLIGADLERGAGQQFRGATGLPPLAAIGSLDDLSVTRQAGALTAREAMALGVNWIFAPVADLDIEPRNPIVGTRAFGADPVRVAAHVSAWIEGCRAEGALSCAKHFPGHGRTTEDSHAMLPVVHATRAELEMDLTPFRAAVIAGVDSIMTAHVAYPALDATGAPATLSTPILDTLLRRELGYEGLVVTDALIMQGVLDAGGGEAGAAVAALQAGCDALLYPQDETAVLAAIEGALGNDLSRARFARSLGRLSAAAAAAQESRGGWGRAADLGWAAGLAKRVVRIDRGEVACSREFDLLSIDDDLGGPYPPPSRAPFLAALRDAGFDPRAVEALDGQRDALIAVYADIRAWKGRPGLSSRALERLAKAIERMPNALVVLMGHPRLAAQIAARNVAIAWGGEAVMQTGAARWLAGETTPLTAA